VFAGENLLESTVNENPTTANAIQQKVIHHIIQKGDELVITGGKRQDTLSGKLQA
jgi:hypothetical protein